MADRNGCVCEGIPDGGGIIWNLLHGDEVGESTGSRIRVDGHRLSDVSQPGLAWLLQGLGVQVFVGCRPRRQMGSRKTCDRAET